MKDPEGNKVRPIDKRILNDAPDGRKTEGKWTDGIEIEELPKAVFIDVLAQVVLKVLIYIGTFLLGLFTGGLGFF